MSRGSKQNSSVELDRQMRQLNLRAVVRLTLNKPIANLMATAVSMAATAVMEAMPAISATLTMLGDKGYALDTGEKGTRTGRNAVLKDGWTKVRRKIVPAVQ